MWMRQWQHSAEITMVVTSRLTHSDFLHIITAAGSNIFPCKGYVAICVIYHWTFSNVGLKKKILDINSYVFDSLHYYITHSWIWKVKWLKWRSHKPRCISHCLVNFYFIFGLCVTLIDRNNRDGTLLAGLPMLKSLRKCWKHFTVRFDLLVNVLIIMNLQ